MTIKLHIKIYQKVLLCLFIPQRRQAHHAQAPSSCDPNWSSNRGSARSSATRFSDKSDMMLPVILPLTDPEAMDMLATDALPEGSPERSPLPALLLLPPPPPPALEDVP
mmetsp:Transcript_13041/g.28587  ORF Transcript_13041/g.28587 Transcript_13041/m.28587 type:complete len:109 (-) Transcript_13041:1948-2274(-)